MGLNVNSLPGRNQKKAILFQWIVSLGETFMLDRLQALLAFSQEGTMSRAAARLRVSTSTISKRIQALEEELGSSLLRLEGRTAVLTPRGEELLAEAEPLLAELNRVLLKRPAGRARRVGLAVSESVLASWGAAALKQLQGELGVDFEVHAHRSPLVLDRVRSGRAAWGVVAGHVDPVHFEVLPWHEEPLVLVGTAQSLEDFSGQEVATIETKSQTFQDLEDPWGRLGLRPGPQVESFFAVARMALSGWWVGWVPLGVAQALGASPSQMRRTRPELSRKISWVRRRSSRGDEDFSRLEEVLAKSQEPGLLGPTDPIDYLAMDD